MAETNSVQAGQKFRAIYDFAAANNVTVVGGADTTVGMSGGWTMVSLGGFPVILSH